MKKLLALALVALFGSTVAFAQDNAANTNTDTKTEKTDTMKTDKKDATGDMGAMNGGEKEGNMDHGKMAKKSHHKTTKKTKKSTTTTGGAAE